MKHKEEKESFKTKLERLEIISDKLEDEDLGLEDAIKLYEEGISLTDECLRSLREAELKITQLKNSLPINRNAKGSGEDIPDGEEN